MEEPKGLTLNDLSENGDNLSETEDNSSENGENSNGNGVNSGENGDNSSENGDNLAGNGKHLVDNFNNGTQIKAQLKETSGAPTETITAFGNEFIAGFHTVTITESQNENIQSKTIDILQGETTTDSLITNTAVYEHKVSIGTQSSNNGKSTVSSNKTFVLQIEQITGSQSEGIIDSKKKEGIGTNHNDHSSY